jgi:hypothetical protein
MQNGETLRSIAALHGSSRSALSRHRQHIGKEAEADSRTPKKAVLGSPAPAPAPVTRPRFVVPGHEPPGTILAPEVSTRVETLPAQPKFSAPGGRAGPQGIETAGLFWQRVASQRPGATRELADEFYAECADAGVWPPQIGRAFDDWLCPPAAAPPPRAARPAPPPPERERESATWPKLPRPDNTAAVAEIQRRTRPDQTSAPAREAEWVSDLLRDDGERPHDRPQPERSLGQRIGGLF